MTISFEFAAALNPTGREILTGREAVLVLPFAPSNAVLAFVYHFPHLEPTQQHSKRRNVISLLVAQPQNHSAATFYLHHWNELSCTISVVLSGAPLRRHGPPQS